MSTESISDEGFQQDIVSSLLLPGENIVHIAAISRGIYWKGVAAMIAALVALLYGFWLAIYCVVVGAVLLMMAYSAKKYLVLAATDHRVIIRDGILNQEVLQLRYPQIESVDTFYSPPGMLLGYGSLVITGTGRARWVVPFVEDADAFRDDLTRKLLEKEEPLVHQAA